MQLKPFRKSLIGRMLLFLPVSRTIISIRNSFFKFRSVFSPLKCISHKMRFRLLFGENYNIQWKSIFTIIERVNVIPICIGYFMREDITWSIWYPPRQHRPRYPSFPIFGLLGQWNIEGQLKSICITGYLRLNPMSDEDVLISHPMCSYYTYKYIVKPSPPPGGS